MWLFKKKPFNIFDQLSKSCEVCNKSFPKEMTKCSYCGLDLTEVKINKKRNKFKSVQYGDKTGKEISQPVFNTKTNSMELHIRGEKYPMRGFPRHHILHGPMAPLKRYIKNLVIEQLVKCLPFKVPDENLVPPVRELARVFDLLIEAEDEPEMKRLMGQLKDAVCMMANEDDAWRYRLCAALQKLDMKKIQLTDGDKYYFRGKSFRVDDFLNDKL